MRPSRRLVTLLLVASTLLVGDVLFGSPARAEVVHGTGYEATVLGWTSWYGSYSLAQVGEVWCIDHGLRAPDATLGYRPSAPPAIADSDRTAMAWVLGRYGTSPPPVDAAAIMLVLHHLNGAVYPYGRLDVDRLAPAQLAGFGGAETAVLHRAQSMLADGRAHGALRGPLALSISMPSHVTSGSAVTASITLRDRVGHGVGGIAVHVHVEGGTSSTSTGTTGSDGSLRVRVTPAGGEVTLHAEATAPSLALEVFGPSGIPAQRVARSQPATVRAIAVAKPSTTRLRIHKHGDDEPRYPVAGARFVVTRRGARHQTIVARLTVADGNLTPWVTLPLGSYVVSEEAPPSGYQRMQPVDVDLQEPTDRTLEVTDHITRPTLRLRKVDASSRRPLAGAIIELASDPDGDGVFTRVGKPITFGTEPVTITSLLPGDYRINELHAPDGYGRFTPRIVHLEPGTQADVLLADPRTPTTTTSTTTDDEHQRCATSNLDNATEPHDEHPREVAPAWPRRDPAVPPTAHTFACAPDAPGNRYLGRSTRARRPRNWRARAVARPRGRSSPLVADAPARSARRCRSVGSYGASTRRIGPGARRGRSLVGATTAPHARWRVRGGDRVCDRPAPQALDPLARHGPRARGRCIGRIRHRQVDTDRTSRPRKRRPAAGRRSHVRRRARRRTGHRP